MGLLLFKKEFFEGIRSGTKTTTIRRWKSPRVKEGQTVFSTGLGWMVVKRVEAIQLEHLTAADARADGFASLEALNEALATFYPGMGSDGLSWWRVTFEFARGIEKEAGLSEGN